MKILGSAYIPETDFAFQLSTTRRSTNICFRSQMIIASYFRSSFGRLRTNSCSKYSFPWTTSESRCLTILHKNPHFCRGIGTECWLRETRPLPECYMCTVDRALLSEDRTGAVSGKSVSVRV